MNPKIENGYMAGTGFDKYDFSFLYKNYTKDFNTRLMNNSAAGFQLVGRIKNYFVFIPVRIKI